MKQSKLFFILGLLFFSLFSNGQEPSEVKIASWTNGELTYDFENGNNEEIQAILLDSLGIAGTLDSIRIKDPDPDSHESIPYLVYYTTGEDSSVVLGHLIIKRVNEENNEILDYFLTNAIEEEDHIEETARAWECTSVPNCTGCTPHRTGFLGLGGVDSCPCTNDAETFCSFKRSGGGSGIWVAVLGAVGAIIAALID